MRTKLKEYIYLVSPFILFIGLLLRWVVYQQNRSLIMDEANLARNIVEKGVVDFFQSLDYHQYCPPLFLLWSKLNITLLGVNEYALKLAPLITGIAVLFLFWLLIKRVIKEDVVEWYLLMLLSFSTLAIRYSTEVKQYTSDTAITLLLIWIALQFKNKKWSIQNSLLWMIMGSLLVWASMPSIFILAAIGFAFLYQSWTTQQKIPIGLVASGVSWIFSFGIYFFSILHQDSATNGLKEYHHNFFFNFLPTNLDELLLSGKLILGLMTSVLDQTLVSFLFGILMLGSGGYTLIKKDKFAACLFLHPVLFALIASNFQLYSLIPRLSLFFIPLLMVVLGIGLATVWNKSTAIIKAGLIVLMIISVVNKEGYQYFWKTMEFENSKACMVYLAKQKKEKELVFVQHDAVPAFSFYNNLHDDAYHLKPIYFANWEERADVVVPKINRKNQKFWLFFSHTFPEDKIVHLSSARKIGKEIMFYESITASVYGFNQR